MKVPKGMPGLRAGLSRTPVALCAALALVAGCGDDDDGPAVGDADVMSEDPTGVATPPGVEEETPVEPTAPGTAVGGADGFDAPEGLDVVTPTGTPDDVTTPWLVYMDLFGNAAFPGSNEVRVELNDYEEDKPFAEHVEFYTGFFDGLDTCLTRDLATNTGFDRAADETDNPRQVSGGQLVLLSTPAGTFGEVPLVEDPGNVYYDTRNTLPGPVPTDAALSIPGEVFPSVDAYPIPTVSRPERLSPAAGEALTSTTVYRWVPGTGNTSVKLDFIADDATTGNLIGFPVTCFPRDDGEFELTDEAVAALVNAPGDISVRFSRVAARIELRDDISFFTYNELAE